MEKQPSDYSYTAGIGGRRMEGKSAGDGKVESSVATRGTDGKILADLRNLDCVIRKIMKGSH